MAKSKTRLVVTIDMEEDNWGQHRSGITCDNAKQIPRLQNIFDRLSIIPTYLVSYQMCLNDVATNILADIHQQGKCEIGCHLHPWNTPPEIESMDADNSMLKNLAYDLQLEKLQILTHKIEEIFGTRPTSFRAGRWGLGQGTIDALIECGYRVDTSVTPTISWKDEGNGPIYKDVLKEPYKLSASDQVKQKNHNILEIPATIGFNRWPFQLWNRVYNIANHKLLKRLHLIGILNRTSILRKIWLSPEGFSGEDLISLASILIDQKRSILNLSFHSNTLLPGKTPFVKTDKDADIFLERIEYFLTSLQSLTELHSLSISDAASHYLAAEA